VILGLAMGFAAGFYIERELKHKKTTPTAKTTQAKKSSSSSEKEEASSSATSTSSDAQQSSETSATQSESSAVTPQPGPVASTPAEAMRKFLQTKGISTSGMSFAVVSVSKADPHWKLDKGTRSGKATLYFLLHNVTGGWQVVDYGETLTAERMRVAGAPADLPAP
jgi:hypothetical protein